MKSLLGLIFVLCVACVMIAESEFMIDTTFAKAIKIESGENFKNIPECLDSNGKPHGKFELYRPDGTIFQAVEYYHGFCVRRAEYDLDGNLICILKEDSNYQLVQVYPPPEPMKKLK